LPSKEETLAKLETEYKLLHMDESSIITQVKKEDTLCTPVKANGNSNHIPAPEKDSKPPPKKRRNRGIFSSLFCCFGSHGASGPGRPFQQQGASPEEGQTDTASVLPVPNHNQNTLTQGYERDEKEEEDHDLADSTSSSPELFYLLPALEQQDVDKKCMVIDLDETLVHSSFKPVQNADFIVPVEIDGTVHQVYVLKRPFVDEFLKRMGELFECVLFTASLAKYADPVADLLDTSGCFRSRLFRESCVFFKGNYVKDLSKLGRDLQNVVIVDNSPASYIFHPQNAIPVMSWFDDKDDTELRDLIPFCESIHCVDSCVVALENNRNRMKTGMRYAVTNGEG